MHAAGNWCTDLAIVSSLHSLILAREANSEVNFGTSEELVVSVNFINKLPKILLLQGYCEAPAGSSQSGAGNIFPTHYKEYRLS